MYTWMILTVGFLVAAAIVPGFKVKGVFSAVVIAALFGILNYFLGGLIWFMLGVSTLGIGFFFSFISRLIANAIVLKLTDWTSGSSQDRRLHASGPRGARHQLGGGGRGPLLPPCRAAPLAAVVTDSKILTFDFRSLRL